MLRCRAARRAFSLIELLVVIAILAMLVALLVPALQAAREAARRTTCVNNLRQNALGLQNYHNSRQAFPIGCLEKSGRRISWNAWLLPYIEQPGAFATFDFTAKFNSAANRRATSTVIQTFLCPSTTRFASSRAGDTTGDRNGNGAYDPGDDMAFTDYGGMFGPAGDMVKKNGKYNGSGVMLYDSAVRLREITDGASHTIIVAEDSGRDGFGVSGGDGEWANGENVFDISYQINVLQDDELWSDHVGGANVAMCDGAVLFLSNDTDFKTLCALCTRAKGELVTAP